MRLLFIYFYKEFGTFEKGSIIHLSKKYKFTLNEKKSIENEFYFNKEENPNFIEEFYSENIDIGVLIGENGTGKSVLLNSIRDKNNDYSICVYEEEKNLFFSLSNQKQIFIKNQKTRKKELNYIYYTSLIDAFDNDINDKYNISNRTLLKKYDDLSLDNRLSLIENDDIHRYFNLSKNLKLDYKKLNKLKLYASKTYFDEVREKLMNNYEGELFESFIKVMNKTKDEIFIEEFLKSNNLKNSNEIIGLYYKLIEKQNFITIFKNNNILIKKFYVSITERIKKEVIEQGINTVIDEIISELPIKDNVVHLFDILENNIFEKNYENIDLDRFFMKTLNRLKLDDFVNKIINYIKSKDFLNINLFNNNKIEQLYTWLILNSFKNNFLKEISLNFKKYIRERKLENRKLLKINETDLIEKLEISLIISIIKWVAIKEKDLLLYLDTEIINELIIKAIDMDILIVDELIGNIKNKLNKRYFFTNFLDKYIKEMIDISENFELIKLLFILMFQEYSRKIKDEDKVRLQGFLNILVNLDNQIDKFKEYKIDNQLPVIELLKKLDEYFKVFKSTKKLDILKEPFHYENNNLVTEVTEDFFDSYELIIKNSIKPFTYEVKPPLSSGQKAILFIFARINDAIKKINQENQNENILILLDEADLKLHLEWQRKFVYDLVEFLNSYSNNKFYLLYATHSPMILSDITNDRVVFLKKKDDKYSEDKQDFTKSTFGANIYDIYSDSFFVDDFMGKFAQNKINDIIKIIDEYKEKKEKNPDEFMPNEKALDNLKIVKNIGEPLLRNKLEDEIKSLVKDDIMEIVNNLKDMKNEEIEKELEKYSQFTQTKVLMKLLEIRK